jgi:hypothetical protein
LIVTRDKTKQRARCDQGSDRHTRFSGWELGCEAFVPIDNREAQQAAARALDPFATAAA